MKKFMNVAVEDKGNNVFVVTKKNRDAVLEECGVTAEIRKRVKKADRTIAFEAMKACGANTIKTKEKTVLKFGVGSESTVFTTKTKNVGRNPQSGEETVTYGGFGVRYCGKAPGDAEFVDELTKMRKKIEKAVSKNVRFC